VKDALATSVMKITENCSQNVTITVGPDTLGTSTNS